MRSCGEYALGILPLNNAQIKKLEAYQYNGIKFLLRTSVKISRVKLLACLGLETVRLRFNVLSAKWLHKVIHHKGDEFLVKQAWFDFLHQPPLPKSSFFYPSTKNPLTSSFRQSTTSADTAHLLNKGHTFSAFCEAFRARLYSQILSESSLPIPSKYTIAKTLHSLGVPRERLRFVLRWLCNHIPFAGQECARCKGKITKTHLESCVVLVCSAPLCARQRNRQSSLQSRVPVSCPECPLGCKDLDRGGG